MDTLVRFAAGCLFGVKESLKGAKNGPDGVKFGPNGVEKANAMLYDIGALKSASILKVG